MFSTDLGTLIWGNCLRTLRRLPDDSVDLVITSPPYDGQPKYGDSEKYERDWYRGFFVEVATEIFRILKPHGSFVLITVQNGEAMSGERYNLKFYSGSVSWAFSSARISFGVSPRRLLVDSTVS